MFSRNGINAITLAVWLLSLTQISHAQGISTTLAAETGNNTAACSGPNDPLGNHAYCVGNFIGFSTSSGNTNAETNPIIDAVPGHMSPLQLSTYLTYSAGTTKFIAPYQPWFCTSDGTYKGPWNGTQTCNLSNAGFHKIVGYSENSASVIAAQHNQMISLGYWAVSPDWYGTSANDSFLNNTVQTQASDLSGRPNYPLKLLVMIDKGAILDGTLDHAGCPQDDNNETVCITAVLEEDISYIDTNWAETPYYARDSTESNLVSTFIPECKWPSVGCVHNQGPTNWDTIWQNVTTYAQQNFVTPMKFIKEFGNFNGNDLDPSDPFTTSYFAGAYAWPQPLPYTDGSNNHYTYPAIPDVSHDCDESFAGCMQFYWNQPGANSYQYLDDFYTQATGQYSGKIAFGELFKGFDWSNASWGGSRNPEIIAQQCGQILVYAANEINTYYSQQTGDKLQYAQTPTWNDYEEGHEVESGVDNCYRVQNASYNQSTDTLSWQLNPVSGQQNYVSTSTLYGFTVWASTSTGILQSIISLPPTATSLNNVSTLVPQNGTWTALYVEMVGMPLIINQMSNEVNYP